MAGLHAIVEGRCGQIRCAQPRAFFFETVEQFVMQRRVAFLEVVPRVLHFVLVVDVAVGDGVVVLQLEDIVDALQIHAQAFESVGDFAHDGFEIDAADLLEVSELRDFHAIEPYFPAETPCAEGGGFPVVVDEADVVLFGIDSDFAERSDVQVEDVERAGLEHDLELVVVLHAVGVVAVAAVLGAAAGFDERGVERLGAERTQEGGGVERSGALFDVVGLGDQAAALAPIVLEREDQVLEVHKPVKMPFLGAKSKGLMGF